jgi:hypothetical protein
MIIATVPALMCLAGCLVYALSSNPKLVMLGLCRLRSRTTSSSTRIGACRRAASTIAAI